MSSEAGHILPKLPREKLTKTKTVPLLVFVVLAVGVTVLIVIAATRALAFLLFGSDPTGNVVASRNLQQKQNLLIQEQQDTGDGGVCPPLDPALTRTRSLSLDRQFVERMNLTLSFQYLMLLDGGNPRNADQTTQDYSLDYYQFWDDEVNDATLIAKQTNAGEDPGICHVAFRATLTPTDFLDNLQNLNPFAVPLEDSDCEVRDGFLSGLFTSYYNQLEQSVDECVAQCGQGSTHCPLVFSGLSQAGGTAVIASIVFRRYNPTVISFGAMRAISGDKFNRYPCTDLNPARHFRFVTSNSEGDYDGIANLRYPLLDLVHTGQTIYMDETNYPLLYLGLNEDVQRLPVSFSIHFRDSYQERINQMLAYANDCYPIPLGKWPAGHVCGYNDECYNNNCIDHQCTAMKLNRGEYCHDNKDCESGRCARGRWYYLDLRKRCRG